ncbi:MAG: hypothetical protein HND55_15205 [Pseudomonadota bacterium]|nr:MAG: hypothetical protein HND55_15205 [Pseudomonadota bacterium]
MKVKVMIVVSLIVALSGTVLADNGSLDGGFGNSGFTLVPFDQGGQNTDQAFAMALQGDGRIVIAGSAHVAGSSPIAPAGGEMTFQAFAVTRLLADGGIDTGFGLNGRQTVNFDLDGTADQAGAVAIDDQGRILVAGTAQSDENDPLSFWGVARLTPNGALDSGFGPDGRVTFAVDENGLGGFTLLNDLLIQPDGRIVLVGAVLVELEVDQQILAVAARLNPDGSLDTGFADQGIARFSALPGSVPETLAMAVSLTDEGKILVAGSVTVDVSGDSNTDLFVTRLLADGSIDSTFADSGTSRVAIDQGGDGEDFAYAMQRDAAGRILLAGSARSDGLNQDMVAVRLLGDGSPDTTFGPGGTGHVLVAFDLGENLRDEAVDCALDDQGRIYLAGQAARSSGADAGIVRLTPGGLPDPAFGNAGRVHYGLAGISDETGAAIAITRHGQAIIAGSAKVAEPDNQDMLAMRLAGERIFGDRFEQLP